MPYALGARSLSFCTHVDPILIRVVLRALEISTQDAGFTEEQSRTLAEEQALVAKGVSHTLKSHHIIGCKGAAPGYSGAVDLVPWTGTAFSWDWDLFPPLVLAMRTAAIAEGVEITWGAIWDRLLNDLVLNTVQDVLDAMNAYVARQRALGDLHPLIDGPHFELGPN
jgi:hypothetical protein